MALDIFTDADNTHYQSGYTSGQPDNETYQAMEQTWRYVKILVVDDDESIRATLRLIFEEEDYTVEEATNGKAALEILTMATTPYVVLLDLMMPQMSGDLLLRVVADDPDLAQQHGFLLVSASPYVIVRDDIRYLLNKLHIPFVYKPFDIDVLITLVQQVSRRVMVRRKWSRHAS